MRLLAGPSLATVCFLVAGCPPSEPEPDLTSILDEPARPSVADPERLEFDFGSVIARDQMLRHEFQLANRSDRTLRVVGSKVMVPCCSSLGKLPESIAPGGEATVPVFLKVGHVADRKRIAFEIKTDSPSLPVRTLYASARIVPEWEVEEEHGERGPMKIGQSSRRTYRVIGRRKAGEGLRAPTEIEASGGLEIESASAATEVEGSDGVIESSRVVIARLPGRTEPGEQIGSLAFRWADGSSRVQEVRWSVKPGLQSFPTAVLLKDGAMPTEVSIEVRSDDRPFRVIKVSGDLVTKEVPPSDRAELTQSLRITLDPSRVVPGVKPAIEVVTDHPDRPKLTLGVLVLPPTKRGSE